MDAVGDKEEVVEGKGEEVLMKTRRAEEVEEVLVVLE